MLLGMLTPNRIPFGGEHDQRREQRPRVGEDQLGRNEACEGNRVADEPAIEVALDGVEHRDECCHAEQHQREPHLAFTDDGLVFRARQTENAVLAGLRERLGWRRHAGQRAVSQRSQEIRFLDMEW